MCCTNFVALCSRLSEPFLLSWKSFMLQAYWNASAPKWKPNCFQLFYQVTGVILEPCPSYFVTCPNIYQNLHFQGSRKTGLSSRSPVVCASLENLNAFRKFHVNSVAWRVLSREIVPIWTSDVHIYSKSSLQLFFTWGPCEIGILGTYDRKKIEQTLVHTDKGKPAGAMAQLEGQGSCLKPPQQLHLACCGTQQATHKSCIF